MNEARSNRQRQIINESIQIIHTKGIQGLTIKNISTAINVTEAAIYRHFKSKDEILSAILDDFRMKLDILIKPVLKANIPAQDKLKSVLNQIIDMFCSNHAIVSVIFSDEIFVNKKVLHDKIIQLITQNNDCFKLIMAEGQQANEIRKDIDSEELAIIIMGSFRMVVKNWQHRQQIYSLKTRANTFFESLLKIISA